MQKNRRAERVPEIRINVPPRCRCQRGDLVAACATACAGGSMKLLGLVLQNARLALALKYTNTFTVTHKLCCVRAGRIKRCISSRTKCRGSSELSQVHTNERFAL